MVKNYLLWIVFGFLLTSITATACLAGQDAEQPEKQKKHRIGCLAPKEKQIVDKVETPIAHTVKEDNKDIKEKEGAHSILNSNFIFYIIYKFKFVDANAHSDTKESNDTASIPILNYSRNFYTFINILLDRYL